ncbi:glucose PTS transporter subunit EIIB [Erwinia persicina]|uniref:PTS sugar transporter n=1 Tax=Erwinia persicina TaxID=55211 RepID=A0A4U3FAY5_9GAMM|nr:glucose PTS transporter subunit EIIB [Erwinia persicina]MBD8108344.1 PTS transporter subunit EIIB [Erwinia persicina]MBD8211431.1 PTS transporter subunit EIIB [Erwinia persicina]TKJ89965.1 PTS sugar transporter [Erwinia persicina]
MVSLKLFKHYFSREKVATEATAEDSVLLDRLMVCFGGRDNIVQVDACLTRLRVTVKSLSAVDNEGLQQAGALGVVILGHEVHAIFGTQSDRLRELMEARFSRQH